MLAVVIFWEVALRARAEDGQGMAKREGRGDDKCSSQANEHGRNRFWDAKTKQIAEQTQWERIAGRSVRRPPAGAR